jgi:subtilisin family serine protease
MRRMGRRLVGLLAALVWVGALASSAGPALAETEQEYVVLYKADANVGTARQAIARAGGRLVKENLAIGLATATSTNPVFVEAVAAQAGVEGAARSRPIGYAPPLSRPKLDEVERVVEEARQSLAAAEAGGTTPIGSPPGGDPLSPLQWNMGMIDATPSGSYAVQRGNRGVLVGIIDTGIDGSHPDIAPNFNRSLSRNFTTDIPLVDGPCEEEPDRSCSDPPDVDENSHGTHVAGIVAAPLNGLGIAGVAPNVTLVNLRAGQDSGFFFLQQTVDALTFAGDNGIDVVNMSFFTDPWLYNCPANPADSPAEQLEQRTVVAATQRAIDYAYNRGVTHVSSLGNQHTDLGRPTIDEISPDFPPGTERTRTVDNSCLTIPTESARVIAVSALGPSGAKADYSNYGVEQADVSAPGGYFRDFFGTPRHRTVANLILSAYPRSVAEEVGDIDETGEPLTPFVVRDCRNGVCGYYQYLQGTSMASPHAAGVGALIVSQFGYGDFRRGGGLTFPPAQVESLMKRTATDHPCPEPRLVSYENVGRPPSWNAFCEGTPSFNGFYGHGIVNALSAVTLRPATLTRSSFTFPTFPVPVPRTSFRGVR